MEPRHQSRPLDTSSRAPGRSPWARWTLITVALLFALTFLLMPLLNVFAQALVHGWKLYFASLRTRTRAAIRLTFTVAGIAVPLNTVCGIAAAWAIAKFQFKGKAALTTVLDLPFAVSPVVVGLMLVNLFGRSSFLGRWLEDHQIQILFDVPGIVLATVFITFPFVARELIPMMQATGTEQEQAALTLGASGWRTFWHVAALGQMGAALRRHSAMPGPWANSARCRWCPATSPA